MGHWLFKEKMAICNILKLSNKPIYIRTLMQPALMVLFFQFKKNILHWTFVPPEVESHMFGFSCQSFHKHQHKGWWRRLQVLLHLLIPVFQVWRWQLSHTPATLNISLNIVWFMGNSDSCNNIHWETNWKQDYMSLLNWNFLFGSPFSNLGHILLIKIEMILETFTILHL